MKLTNPQRELLSELPTTCAESYAPAKALVRLGLAEWDHQRFGDRLVLTEAGKRERGDT